jgi:hypothetical protein
MTPFESRYYLRKPLFVYALGICFIAAPVGNIIASMVGFGIYQWYSPSVVIDFLKGIAWLDRCWLLLTFLAGIALFFQRRWSWLFAIGALIVASLINFRYSLEFSSKLSTGGHFFPALFMLSNIAVIAVLYHFRFPYLDRREAFWGIYPRFRCSLPISAAEITGMATNISRSGAFIEIKGGRLEMGRVLRMKLGPISELEAEVVHVAVGTAGGIGTGYGIEFRPSGNQSSELKKLVQEVASEPLGRVTA